MSHEALPITNAQFAQAIEDLPIENIYAKAFEINNSIAHLTQSNKTLQEYSDSIKNDRSLNERMRNGGDKDCLEAIEENEMVIQRQRDRIALLKAEVERRGARWHDADPERTINGSVVNGVAVATTVDADTTAAGSLAPTRRLNDELRQEMAARLGTSDADADDEGGLHL